MTADFEDEEYKQRAKERMENIAKILATKKHKELWTRAQAFYDHQKLRIAQFNRIGMYEKLKVDMSGLEWYPIAMKEIEDRFQKEMLQFVKKEKVWDDFLSKVKGIGPVMAAGLIAWFDDPTKANTPSKMWKYAGLAVTDGVADRRRKGEKELGFNPKLKVHMWKIGKQLFFAKGNYYQYYLEQKEMISQKHAPKTDVESLKPDERKKYWQEHPDEWPNGKMHRYALRKMQKLFLANFWEAWRISEGLPTPPPYAEAILGHVDIIHYWEMVDRRTDVMDAGKKEEEMEDEIDD